MQVMRFKTEELNTMYPEIHDKFIGYNRSSDNDDYSYEDDRRDFACNVIATKIVRLSEITRTDNGVEFWGIVCYLEERTDNGRFGNNMLELEYSFRFQAFNQDSIEWNKKYGGWLICEDLYFVLPDKYDEVGNLKMLPFSQALESLQRYGLQNVDLLDFTFMEDVYGPRKSPLEAINEQYGKKVKKLKQPETSRVTNLISTLILTIRYLLGLKEGKEKKKGDK